MSNKPDSNETTNDVPIEVRISVNLFLITATAALLSIPFRYVIKEWQDHKDTMENIEKRLQAIEEQKDNK